MPHFIVLGAAAVAAYAGWKFLKREMARVDERLAEAREGAARVERGKTLERDPNSGVYRPRDDARG